jgi:uncharacterized protein (DUF1330 family)
MSAYAIFDVEIYDMERYREYMARVQPALEAAGGAICLVAGSTKYMRVTGCRDVL